MKRFLLFTGMGYYPRGGWSDFVGVFDSLEEAKNRGRQTNDDWYQVVDTETMKEVEEEGDKIL
jgi:hypothetical protein